MRDIISLPTLCPYLRMAGSVEYHYRALKQTLLPRRLLDYQLFYIVSGTGCIELSDRKVNIRSGDVCLIQPGVVHSYWFKKSRIIYLHFDLFFHPYRQSAPIIPGGRTELSDSEKAAMQPALRDIPGLNPPLILPVRDHDAVMERLNAALDLFRRTPPLHQLMLQEIIAGFVSRFVHAGSAEERARTLNVQERLDRAVLHMKGNLHERTKLTAMARVAGLSPSHFSHEFRKRFGIGPVHYMNRLRMNAAAERIKSRPGKILVVAREFGYDNPLNFSRDFKRVLGVGPRAVRDSENGRFQD